jgi:hypothetical protein
MSNIIAFPLRSEPADVVCLSDHAGALQAKMFLSLFRLREVVNDLTQLADHNVPQENASEPDRPNDLR